MAEQDITVVDNSYTVTSIEDNYTVHVLDGLGIPGVDGEPGPPGELTNPVDYIRWITEPVAAPDTEGTGSWDPTTHLLKLRSDIPGSFLNVGLENWVRVRNMTGAVIPNGRFVTGVASDKPKVFDVVLSKPIPGQAAISGLTTSQLEIYVEEEEHGEGWAATFGHAGDVDTTDLGVFKTVYISDDPLKPGEPTLIPPSPPNYPIPMGFSVDQQVGGNLFIFAVNPVSIIAAVDAAVASGDPTGFHDGDNIGENYDPVARTMTLTHASGVLKYTWRGQVNEFASPWVSPAHPDVLDTGYFLYSEDGKTFAWTETPWLFTDIMAAFAWYGTDDKFAIREPHGLMGWQNHQEFHQTNGTYRVSGGDVSGYVIDSTVPAERRPDVSLTVVKDEDSTTYNPLLDTSLYTRGYLTGAGVFAFVKDDTEITALNGVVPLWNEFDGNDWLETEVANNQYMSIWLVAIPTTDDAGSQTYRYLWLMGQSSGTLNSELGLVPEGLTFGNFQTLFTEFVFIEQQILRNNAGNWRIAASKRLTGTRNQQVGSPSGNYLSVVTHDDTLENEGTPDSPLSVLSGVPRAGAAGDSIQKNSAADFDFGILKNNLFAIIPPTVDDDALAGYGVDSRWIDQAGLSIYQCIDSTVGAAVWVDLTGGGGGLWEIVESRPMTGNIAELFDLGDDDNVMFVFDSVTIPLSSTLDFALSIDGGVSYPATHSYTGQWIRENTNTYLGRKQINDASIFIMPDSVTHGINGSLTLEQVSQALNVTEYVGDIRSITAGGLWIRLMAGGILDTVGVVNKIKIHSFDPLEGGTIHHLKRTF